MTWTNQKGKHH